MSIFSRHYGENGGRNKSGDNDSDAKVLAELPGFDEHMKEDSENGEKNEKFLITSDTTLNEIEGNIESYLRNDPNLNSNLLVYALKQKTPEELNSIFEAPTVRGPDEEHIAEMRERIKNFETYETENYVFMLPKDKWEEGKTNIPDDPEGRFIVSENLTAVVKQPFLNQENKVVYNRDDVGKEVCFFEWDKELLNAKKNLLELNGYTIPEWSSIIKKVGDEIGSFPMMGDVGCRIDGDRELALWEEKLGLNRPGIRFQNGDEVYGVGEKGEYWSDEKNNASVLDFRYEKKNGSLTDSLYGDRGTGTIYVSDFGVDECMCLVRCVSCEKTAPDNYEEASDDDEVSEDGEAEIAVETVNEKKKEKMETLKEQKYWSEVLTDISTVIRRDLSKGVDWKGKYSKPAWVSYLESDGWGKKHSFGRMGINAITSDNYNNSKKDELASGDNKRIVFMEATGYAVPHNMATSAQKDVGGFNLKWTNGDFYEPFLPEETDFTIENEVENEDIPERINNAMYKLFAGFKFSHQERAFVHAKEKYPDKETLESVLGELGGIIDDIGDVDEKIDNLEREEAKIQEQKEVERRQEEAIKEKVRVSEIIEAAKNGAKLNNEELRLIFKDEYSDEPGVVEVRQGLGIEEETMRKLLGL